MQIIVFDFYEKDLESAGNLYTFYIFNYYFRDNEWKGCGWIKNKNKKWVLMLCIVLQDKNVFLEMESVDPLYQR